jgi:hypothetical protein
MRLIACIEKYFEFDSDEQINLKAEVMKERLAHRQKAEVKLFRQLTMKNKAIQVEKEPELTVNHDCFLKMTREPARLRLGHIPASGE